MNGHATGKLAGKTAVVTGAARGLGRAYALRLAALGADVAVVDIRLDAAREYGEALTEDSVAEEIERLGRRSLGIQADLAQHDEAVGAIRRAHAAFGRIDILVNNAGGALTPAERSRASETPEQDTRFLLDINYMSAVHCCQAAAAIMKPQRSGVIFNISSQSGITTYQQGLLAAYSAAKAALTHYTRYLAAELGPFGIRANCLAPGIMMTSRVAAQAALRHIGTNEEADRIPLRRLGDTLYVVDEPTTGLHPADVEKLIAQLDGLVESGNTVIVVEHDMRFAAGSDWVMDIGPGAGDEGGHVVAFGTPAEVADRP